jgi:hypothetical protein
MADLISLSPFLFLEMIKDKEGLMPTAMEEVAEDTMEMEFPSLE